MYPKNPEGTQIIVGSMNMDIYPILPGIDLQPWSILNNFLTPSKLDIILVTLDNL